MKERVEKLLSLIMLLFISLIRFAKGVGTEILYLPPYSPDFNKIEHYWFAIKNRTRKNIPLFKSFRHAVDSSFL